MNTTTEIKDPNTLPAWFQELPAGRKMVDDHRREVETKRTAAIAEIAQERAAWLKKLPGLDEAVMKAEDEARAAEEALRAAMTRLQAARNDRNRESFAFERRLHRAHTFLRTTTPKAILAFLAKLRAESESLRNEEPLVAAEPLGKYNYEGREAKNIWSKMPSIGRRANAIGKILSNSGDGLHLTLATEESAVARIAELEAGLPPIQAEIIDTRTN